MSRHIIRLLRTNQVIRIKNSLETIKEKEVLSSYEKGRLKWYSCGPTIYDDAHLGHARAYVTFDVLRRILLKFTDIKQIDYALGITDIDDKIINRAKERKQDLKTFTQFYERRFFDDMNRLNVLIPSKVLRVTEHIQDIQTFINELQIKGNAYHVQNTANVYFSINSVPTNRYLQLDSSRHGENENESSSNQFSNEKKDSRDFALWKSNQDIDIDKDVINQNHCCWSSKWGSGRPGWHIECSAMSINAFGDHLDIHTGGIDLKFPHHTNELATAEAHLNIDDNKDKRWVQFWLHAGHLHISGYKMSKSLKNFISIHEFLSSNANNNNNIDKNANIFRLFCLLNKYKSSVEYSEDRMIESNALLNKISRFLKYDTFSMALDINHLIQFKPSSENKTCETTSNIHQSIHDMEIEIDNSIADDFDTPRLFRSILNCIQISKTALVTNDNTTNVVSGEAAIAYDLAKQKVEEILSSLGFKNLIQQQKLPQDATTSGKGIDLLVDFRSEIRKAARNKDIDEIFKICDSIRQQIKSQLDITVTDNKDGSSSWE